MRHLVRIAVATTVVALTAVAVITVLPSTDAGAMNLKPLHDNVVVRAEDGGGPASMGPAVPGRAMEAEVVAVGPGEWEDGERIPLDVSVGDLVYFLPSEAFDVEVGGVEYFVVKDDFVLAILG